MIGSLDLARQYCRASSADDAVLTVLVEAAEAWAVQFLDRRVFADQANLDDAVSAGTAGDRPMVVNAAFTAAVLEIVSDRYDNRENDAAPATMTRAEKLLWPFRVGLGV